MSLFQHGAHTAATSRTGDFSLTSDFSYDDDLNPDFLNYAGGAVAGGKKGNGTYLVSSRLFPLAKNYGDVNRCVL